MMMKSSHRKRKSNHPKALENRRNPPFFDAGVLCQSNIFKTQIRSRHELAPKSRCSELVTCSTNYPDGILAQL